MDVRLRELYLLFRCYEVQHVHVYYMYMHVYYMYMYLETFSMVQGYYPSVQCACTLSHVHVQVPVRNIMCKYCEKYYMYK